LRSQKADHGATTRMKPASRKYAANRTRVKNEMTYPPVCTRDKRSTRAATSLYSPASA
jgi:hypothetical protein